jgi:hypothetical protein
VAASIFKTGSSGNSVGQNGYPMQPPDRERGLVQRLLGAFTKASGTSTAPTDHVVSQAESGLVFKRRETSEPCGFDRPASMKKSGPVSF